MKILTLTAIFLLLTACGGGSGGSDTDRFPTNNAPYIQTAGWVAGEYSPSSYFANRCIDPRSNDSYQDLLGTYVDENNWLRSWSYETYLWYEELPDIDPETITDPGYYFDLMKTNVLTNSGQDKDQFHYARDTEEYEQYAESGISAGYGFTVSLIESSPPRKVVVVFTEPGSPAADKGIRRGAEIISVDGAAIANGNADILNAGLFPSALDEWHNFVIRDLNGTSDRPVTLQSSEITVQPVHTSTVIPRGNNKIGYIVLNTFNVATAEQQLINAINNLIDENINKLILDLRYNGGGYLAISAELGTMVAGNRASNEIFTQIVFNNKQSMDNESYQFPPTAYGLSAPEGTELPKLNLSQVYILSSGDTASASESLINGLRGIDVEVILIGDTTRGKPYGFLPEDNCGTTYFTIQFKGENAAGFGDYADGFIPSTSDNRTDRVRGCRVDDDLTHLLGDSNENMLATALHFIDNDSCPTSAQGLASKPQHPLSAVQGNLLTRYPDMLLLR